VLEGEVVSVAVTVLTDGAIDEALTEVLFEIPAGEVPLGVPAGEVALTAGDVAFAETLTAGDVALIEALTEALTEALAEILMETDPEKVPLMHWNRIVRLLLKSATIKKTPGKLLS